MSTGILALAGFVMVAVIVYGLVQSKITPIPVFVIVSVLTALAVGTPPTELFAHVHKGVTTTMPIAVLFIFSIVYFCIMNDVGMFDPLVNLLVKMAKTNVVLVTIATAVIAILGHLDGALASTLLITIPAMLPVYKRLNMRPLTLLVIIGAAMSIMNLLPWGGPVARTAAITKVDINVLWNSMIPLQVMITGVVIAFAAFMGIVEKKRGAGLPAGEDFTIAEEKLDPKVAALKRPKLVWFNILLTLGIIALLCFTKVPLYAAFMFGLSIALVVNFPNAKDQAARFKAHAGEALPMASILLGAGVFLGVLTGTKMIDAMATTLIGIIPNALGPYLHVIMGLTAVPVGCVLGTDSYFFGLVPLAVQAGAKFGIDPVNMAKIMLIGKNYGVLVTPHAATTYLAIGLAGVELKEHLKYCTFWLTILSFITLIVAALMGVVSFAPGVVPGS
ncbi:MAG: citrate:proton symporter [Deltaproteobacteria bacterium]|jgi:CitMHS family citrate-Mg2+:H+ or citrate-Ca2+:H+ symporter|nr:citrate:proton symporter [Deltaproteobacteria bacterium]